MPGSDFVIIASTRINQSDFFVEVIVLFTNNTRNIYEWDQFDLDSVRLKAHCTSL